MKSRASLAVSLLIHIVLLVAIATLTVSRPKFLEQPPGMELELIDVEHAMALPDPEVSRAEPQEAEALPAPDQGQVPQQVESQPTPVPPAPVPQPATPPAPQPKPVPVQKPAPEAPQLGVGAVAPKPKPAAPAPAAAAASALRAQPAPAAAAAPAPAPPRPRPQVDAGALARMLAAKAGTARQSRINSAAIGSALGRAAPKGAASLTVRQRANLEDMIRSQVTPCWNPPVPEEGDPNLTVLTRIKLARTGALIGEPAASLTRAAPANSAAYGRALVASVRRAVVRCAPLKLPPELYDAWADVELNFDPKDIR